MSFHYPLDGGGIGVVDTVSNVDGSLIASPTTGNVIVSLNTGHANHWTALQEFNSSMFQLDGSTSGHIQISAADITTNYAIKMPSAQGAASTVLTNDGSGNLSWATGGAVTSVSNSDGTLTISPTTGAVVASIALTNSNIWTPSAGTFFRQPAIATTPTPSVFVDNVTVSTLAVPVQISAALEFRGKMFRTGDSSDNTGTFRMYEIPVSGATAGATHAGTLQWDSSKNGVYAVNIMNLGRTGLLTTSLGFTATNGNITASNGAMTASGSIVSTNGQVQAGTDLLTGTNGGTAGHVYFYGSTSGNFSISAPAVVTNYNSIWPGAQGTGALTNDGAGNLSWTAAGGTVTTDSSLTGDGSGGSPLSLNTAHSNTWSTAQVFQIATSFGQAGGAAGEIDLLGSTSGQVAIKAPAVITNYSIIMPIAQAFSANQTLLNDGTGALSWAYTTTREASGTGTAQTAAVAATTLFTPTASVPYRVSFYLIVTTVASVSSILGGAGGVVLTYNDATSNVAQSITVPFSDSTAGGIITNNAGNTKTTRLQGTVFINARSGVAVQYAIGYTSTGTAMQYAYTIVAERV